MSAISDAEAGGGDAEHDDQADRRRQYPSDCAQRVPGERDARLPADQHVADLDQNGGHRQPERQPGELQDDGQRQRPEQPGTGESEEPTTSRADEISTAIIATLRYQGAEAVWVLIAAWCDLSA